MYTLYYGTTNTRPARCTQCNAPIPRGGGTRVVTEVAVCYLHPSCVPAYEEWASGVERYEDLCQQAAHVLRESAPEDGDMFVFHVKYNIQATQLPADKIKRVHDALCEVIRVRPGSYHEAMAILRTHLYTKEEQHGTYP